MWASAGILFLLLGLLASLIAVDLKARRFYDRPAVARNRIFDPLFSLLRWGLLLGGLLLICKTSRPGAAVAGAVLFVLWGYRRFVRSLGFQRWLLERDYRRLKRRYPARSEREILYELAYARNPRWGEELIEQMVLDCPDIDSLARMIARMERGFRGFK